ncbi:Fe-S cluster assembly protein SufD [Paenibacillus cellulosilyticus]|uniref:Fe-S cluster assembly protein SufD n=1 Tax=Paenibacillus cellulosilyticus TaxID=375489 RepID=A0A2V2YW30_9BACL|nr:Fe-S cluster assembly protein SufD [Paenibacillus cellulosilyticus]PWW01144.1 Fe-S cluster assembly protein SufD [Paenibacillus cellulosilyticus]QKS46892.1 Fe-S cluster assembly protein SufD [Paenibacillus cellulosilyticus]
MSIQLSTPVNRQAAEALSRSKGEPEWLTAKRADAAELVETLELPKVEKTRIDRWNLSAYGQYKAAQPVSSAQELSQDIQAFVTESQAGLLVTRGSGAVFSTLSDELKAQGVIFTDLETAAREHGAIVQQYLHTVVPSNEDKLTALHSALWNGGVFVYVPKNVEVELPLQALLYNDDAEATFAPHVLIVAEANSRVTYVDNVITTGSAAQVAAIHHGIVEVVAKAGAKVSFASIHSMGEEVVDISIRRAALDNDARVEWIIGDLNDGNTLSDTKSVLNGRGSSSDSKVISIGSKKQKLSLTTQAVHWGKSTDSQMITRAVMREEATAIINGITKIEKGATKANGEQTEKVLMLSPKSRGDANPILLIDEDDVTAGHAASVGQVNPEQVYYLMSRGIAKIDAERLIIYGFLAPVVSEIPIDAVREQLQRLLERKLEA